MILTTEAILNTLSEWELEILPVTNRWRELNGIEPIPVPQSNKQYWYSYNNADLSNNRTIICPTNSGYIELYITNYDTREYDVRRLDKNKRLVTLNPNHCNQQLFSYYQKSIKNTKSKKEITLHQLYNATKSECYKDITHHLRSLEYDSANQKNYKLNQFDSVTLAGVFEERKEASLVKPTNYWLFDFDHLDQPEKLKQDIIRSFNNHTFNSLAFLSISARGKGIHLVLELDCDPLHKRPDKYELLCDTINQSLDISPDRQTKDIARACFISYDPTCFINPKYLD